MAVGDEGARRPNILLVVADDHAANAVGCYGGPHAVTPRIDTLARDGMRFDACGCTNSLCAPSRATILTGTYNHVNGVTTLSTEFDARQPAFPGLLRDAGYRTALVGKWHLGYPPAFGPLRSGYDEFFGPMSGGVDYFTHCGFTGQHDLWFGEEERAEEGYLTDLLSRRAVNFVERMAARNAAEGEAPFFLSLHYTAPHWPWETREDAALAQEVKDNLFHLHGGNVHTYRRMIHHMDEGIGWVMQALRRHGLERDTLVIFTSDNGGERFSDSWPLVGGKMDLTEGGIRVPWIAHWPALIGPGQVSAQHCMTMDWSATVLEAGGARADAAYPLDGVSLLEVLRDPGRTFARPLHWRMKHRGQRALRDGDWKYLRVDGHDYLFDLRADERERANLAGRDPARLMALRDAWESWNEGMPAIPPDATVSLGYSVADMPQR